MKTADERAASWYVAKEWLTVNGYTVAKPGNPSVPDLLCVKDGLIVGVDLAGPDGNRKKRRAALSNGA